MTTTTTYAYVRFSSEEQSKGDSLRRQIEGVTEYAKRHNLELLESNIIQDLGVSAFDGSNVSKGNLGKFLEKVQGGKIARGSILIVESLDRLSRLGISESQELLRTFRQAGITVRTYVDGHVYNANEFGLIDLVVSGVKQATANEESIKKQDRVKKAWDARREKATKEPIGGRCPGWLTFNKTKKQFVVDQGKAKIVQKIFADSAAGLGNVAIMRRLNSENILPFGNSHGWYTSSIAKLLANRAVIGEFQMCEMVATNRRRPIGDPIPNYYPGIVSTELFYKVQQCRKDRLVGDHKRGIRTTGNFANLFGGIAFCTYCNGPMLYEDKGNGRGSYFLCSNARRGRKDVCTVKTSWLYSDFENSFLHFVEEVDLESILNADADALKRAKIQNEIASLQGRLSSITDNQNRAFDLLTKTTATEFVAKKLDELKTEHDALVKEIANRETELASLTTSKVAFSEIKDVIAQLQTKNGDVYALRAQVAMKLRSMIDAISIAPIGIPDAELKKLMKIVGEKNPAGVINQRFFSVKFKSGAMKDIMPSPTDPTDYVEIAITDPADVQD